MPYQPPLRERVVAQCEHQMEVQGYVRFTDIATAENVTRSRIGQGLNEAVTHKLISDEQAKAWLRLSFAQTYASCQGTEFAGSLGLHDTDSAHFSRRHLFVGLSRARGTSLVSVV